MTIEELKQKLISEDEAAFFVGGFGGAMVEAEELRDANCSDDYVIEVARQHGYHVTVVEEEDEEEPKQKKRGER